MAKGKGAWNAVKAVLLVAVLSAAVSVVAYKFMHGLDPCHAVNTSIIPSPDGAFTARKVELSCKVQGGTDHQVQIAVSERNNQTGKSKQFGNVFMCSGVTASEVSMEWTGPRQLALDYPQEKVGPIQITAQQPHFKDVMIQYGEKK